MTGQLDIILAFIALYPFLRALNALERWYRLTYRKDPRYIPSDFDF